jgi:hypothetical protein
LFLFFAEISPAIFFGGDEFSLTLKPNFQRSLGPMPTFPFPGGVGEHFFRKIMSGSPDFAPRDGPPAHKV